MVLRCILDEKLLRRFHPKKTPEKELSSLLIAFAALTAF